MNKKVSIVVAEATRADLDRQAPFYQAFAIGLTRLASGFGFIACHEEVRIDTLEDRLAARNAHSSFFKDLANERFDEPFAILDFAAWKPEIVGVASARNSQDQPAALDERCDRALHR